MIQYTSNDVLMWDDELDERDENEKWLVGIDNLEQIEQLDELFSIYWITQILQISKSKIGWILLLFHEKTQHSNKADQYNDEKQ